MVHKDNSAVLQILNLERETVDGTRSFVEELAGKTLEHVVSLVQLLFGWFLKTSLFLLDNLSKPLPHLGPLLLKFDLELANCVGVLSLGKF